MSEQQGPLASREVPTRVVDVAGAGLVYRDLGPRSGVPLVVLTHLGANLDGWDPRILEGLSQDRRVIALSYRGVGDSTGQVRDSIEEMAADALGAIQGLGFDRIDLFGLSMGGMVAQAMAAKAPGSIDRLILASSGPAGGPGILAMTRVMVSTVLRAAVTFTDPRVLLFFTRTPAGRLAAREYLVRLRERRSMREKGVSPGVYRAQLAAVHRWGRQQPADLSVWSGPVWIVHGDSDRMVPPANAAALAGLLPAASVTMYLDAGHGAVFQHHSAFVAAARDFLRR